MFKLPPMDKVSSREDDVSVRAVRRWTQGKPTSSHTVLEEASPPKKYPPLDWHRDIALALSTITVVAIGIFFLIVLVLQIRRYQVGSLRPRSTLKRIPIEFARPWYLNESVQPCHDFYAFACRHEPTRRRDSHQIFRRRLAEMLNATNPPFHEVNTQQRAESFFQSCVLSNYMPPSGGHRAWFINFCGDTLSEGNHFLVSLANLSMYWRLHLLFHIHVEDARTIFLEELNPEDWRDQKAWLKSSGTYEEFIMNALRNVLENTTNLAQKAARVKSFEDTLDAEFFAGPPHTSRDPDNETDVRGLANMTPKVSLDRWIVSLSSVLSLPFNDSSPVRIMSKQVIRTINFLAEYVEEQDVGLLLRWLVMKKLYSVQYVPLTTRPHDLALQCLQLCEAAMGMAMALPFLHDLRDGISIAANLTSRLLKAFSFRFHGSTWLDRKSAFISEDRVLNTSVEMGLPLIYRDHIERLYSELQSLDIIFLKNWITVCHALRKFVGHSELPWFRVSGRHSMFSVASSRVWLPPWRLIRPWFNYRDSPIIWTSLLGSHIAVMTMLAFGRAPLGNWTDGVKLDYERRRRCLTESYVTDKDINVASIQLAYATALETALDTAQAHYYPWTKDEWHQHDNYTVEQTFFIGWCQLTCGQPSPGLCNVPLKNSYRFAHAFKCAVNVPMNPRSKCVFW